MTQPDARALEEQLEERRGGYRIRMTRIPPIAEARAAANRHAFELAISLLRPMAESGDPEAQYQLGYEYASVLLEIVESSE